MGGATEVIHCNENNHVAVLSRRCVITQQQPCVEVWQAVLSNLDGNGWSSGAKMHQPVTEESGLMN